MLKILKIIDIHISPINFQSFCYRFRIIAKKIAPGLCFKFILWKLFNDQIFIDHSVEMERNERIEKDDFDRGIINST